MDQHLDMALAKRFRPEDCDAARSLLESYGVESYEREVDRVRRVLVQSAGTSMKRLELLVKMAKVDYRDVLIGDRGRDEPWP